MTTVLVSGCYDILHAGHIAFFESACALGDRLVVCVAGDDVLLDHKGHLSAMPAAHKAAIIGALRCVDDVRITDGELRGLDFQRVLIETRADVLAVTDDDLYEAEKRKLCDAYGVAYVRLPKTEPACGAISTSDIRRRCSVPDRVPVRVDFAGGWLDVPRFAIPGAYIVNCTVTPMVSLTDWPYHYGGGIGGSAARAILEGRDPFASELGAGVGWQDPAVILETGLCVWNSAPIPYLVSKHNCIFLLGRMAIRWTGQPHSTPDLACRKRDYAGIATASRWARDSLMGDTWSLEQAINATYALQIDEGMEPLSIPNACTACKYIGAGWGGYALYVFPDMRSRNHYVASHHDAIEIEPYMRSAREFPGQYVMEVAA